MARDREAERERWYGAMARDREAERAAAHARAVEEINKAVEAAEPVETTPQALMALLRALWAIGVGSGGWGLAMAMTNHLQLLIRKHDDGRALSETDAGAAQRTSQFQLAIVEPYPDVHSSSSERAPSRSFAAVQL